MVMFTTLRNASGSSNVSAELYASEFVLLTKYQQYGKLAELDDIHRCSADWRGSKVSFGDLSSRVQKGKYQHQENGN
jgi:hypothetical protein